MIGTELTSCQNCPDGLLVGPGKLNRRIKLTDVTDYFAIYCLNIYRIP